MQFAAAVFAVMFCANISTAQLVSDLPAGSSVANWTSAKIDTPGHVQSYLNRQVSLRLKNIPLVSALAKIAAITQVSFSYGDRAVAGENEITADLNDVTLGEALSRVLEGTNLTWVPMKGDHIVIKEKKSGDQGTGIITGKVTDATTGNPLPGATVFLKGTSMGASADLDGNYIIPDIPSGPYTIRISYVGYTTRDITANVVGGERLKMNLKLRPVGVKGKEVVVTAQASGQNAAINQQLSSKNIVNVVSAARIQELPDANAAESVGRLPGVSLVRSGGEATGIVIRGLQPKYNEILIDGVQMAATSGSNRSTDLSMISSNSLSGIEVYKTVTPDMDAAVLGGVVNFKIREAQRGSTNIPKLGFLAQGGYNDLVNSYDNYKFVATAENRYWGNRFGVFAQGIVEKLNHTEDQYGGGFSLTSNLTRLTGPHNVEMTNLNLSFVPREQQRYDGTLVLDYRLPSGKVDMMNFFSSGISTQYNYEQSYGLKANTITFDDSYSRNLLNTLTNLLDYKQMLGSMNMDVKLSNSFSENNSPNNWNFSFITYGAGVGTIDATQSPTQIAQEAFARINTNKLLVYQLNIGNSYSKQRNLTGSIDLTRTLNLSKSLAATLRAGGQYMYTYRWYGQGAAGSSLQGGQDQPELVGLINAFPWMSQPPYNIPADGTVIPSIKPFIDPNFNYGNFLNGDYSVGPGTNMNLLLQAIRAVQDTAMKQNYQTGVGAYKPNSLNPVTNDYYGSEYRSAGYIMATLDFGSKLTLIPGVRYQGLLTSYTAARIYNPNFNIGYPVVYPHQDTTMNEYHGYWLPDVSLIYRPLTWLITRLAFTNTLSYPDFTQITPLIQVGSDGAITWHNFALKPAHSQNYDFAVSIYDNSIGLLTADAFLKQIDGLIFGTGDRYPADFAPFPGVPANLPVGPVYHISYSINDPFRTNVWGAEAEWQTHFWYLPNPLNDIVLSVNYTHLFSGAKYPFTYNYQIATAPYVVYVDTFYTDRLYQQPDDIANLSIGYDYKGFSILVSMIYQGNVFNSNNFWPQLRVDKARYERWDLSAKQNLPWRGLEIYLDVNDLNSENDVYVIQGLGFPSSSQDYGMTADMGIRWKL